jgi:cytochrome b-561
VSHAFISSPLHSSQSSTRFSAQAILLYRVFRNSEKIYVKLAHALVHVLALLFAAIALKAVFDSHNLASPPIPNLYSLHSWFGLAAVILFIAQWVLGFTSFLYPKMNERIRRAYLPAHRLWGVVIFVMICATALMGITEKAIFSVKYVHRQPPPVPGLSFIFVWLEETTRPAEPKPRSSTGSAC